MKAERSRPFQGDPLWIALDGPALREDHWCSHCRVVRPQLAVARNVWATVLLFRCAFCQLHTVVET